MFWYDKVQILAEMSFLCRSVSARKQNDLFTWAVDGYGLEKRKYTGEFYPVIKEKEYNVNVLTYLKTVIYPSPGPIQLHVNFHSSFPFTAYFKHLR